MDFRMGNVFLVCCLVVLGFFFPRITRLQIMIFIFNINVQFGCILWQMTWMTDSGLTERVPKLHFSAHGVFYTQERCFGKEWYIVTVPFLGCGGPRGSRHLVIRVLCPFSCPQWWDTSICVGMDETGHRGNAQPSVTAAVSLAPKLMLETLVQATEPCLGCLGNFPEISYR